MKSLRDAALYVCLGVSVLMTGCGGGSGGTGGGGSGGGNNPTPAVSSISPTSAAQAGSSLTLTVNGSGFVSGSQVQWGSATLSTTYVSSTSLTAQVPASDLASQGTFAITVTSPSPGGGTSAAVNFSVGNPVPVVSSLQPGRATVKGPAFTLTVKGSGFLSTSSVQWNGSSLATTYVSDTSLTAQVPASDLAGSTGPIPVTVTNPSPNGGTSAAMTFSVVAPATYVSTPVPNAYDIVWDSARRKLYASVPASQGNQGGMVTIDPSTGEAGSPVAVGNGPDALAVSSDNNLLYAGLDGVGQIRRFHLPDMSIDSAYKQEIQNLGNKQAIAISIAAAPDNPDEIAAVLGIPGTSSYGVAVIASNGLGFPFLSGGGSSASWGADHSTLIAGGRGGGPLIVEHVGPNGHLYGPTTYWGLFWDSRNAHFDKASGLVYLDSGFVVDPATGSLVWAFDLSPISPYAECGGFTCMYFPLSIPDKSLGVVYFLGQTMGQDMAGAGATIVAFDMKTGRQLRTLVLPDTKGYPQKFIRWGTSGLAFTTASRVLPDSPTAGPVYVVEGEFVNPSTTPDASVGDVVYSAPRLTAVSPQSATAGSKGVTITLTGNNFDADTSVTWALTPLPTTLISPTQVQASVPHDLLATPGSVVIQGSDSVSGLTSSNSLIFTILPSDLGSTKILPVNLASMNLLWDPKSGQLVAPVWGGDSLYPNTVVTIDPASGSVTRSAPVHSDPRAIALSDDGAYVYTGYSEANSITRLSMPNLDSPFEWTIPADPSNGLLYADFIQVAPGAAQTVAVDFGALFIDPPPMDGVTLFDNGVARPNSFIGTPDPGGEHRNDTKDYWLQWSPDGSTLYTVSYPFEVAKMSVDSSGLTGIGAFDGQVYADFPDQSGMHMDAATGLLYFNTGNVYDPVTGNMAGTYGEAGLIAVDSALKRVFILTADNSGNYSIDSFDQLKFTKLASLPLPKLFGSPWAFVRWGTNGLAFMTFNSGAAMSGVPAGMLYILSDDKLVSAQSTATAEKDMGLR